MATLTVRNLPEATHRALRLRAAENNRSTEAEVRAILEDVVRPKERVRVGSELAAFAKKYGGIELHTRRDRTPIERDRPELPGKDLPESIPESIRESARRSRRQ